MKKQYDYLTLSLFALGALLIIAGSAYIISNFWFHLANKILLGCSFLGTAATLVFSTNIKNKYFAYTLSTLGSLLFGTSLYLLKLTYIPGLSIHDIIIFWFYGALFMTYFVPTIPIIYEITIAGALLSFTTNTTKGIMPYSLLFLTAAVTLTICSLSIIYPSKKYLEI